MQVMEEREEGPSLAALSHPGPLASLPPLAFSHYCFLYSDSGSFHVITARRKVRQFLQWEELPKQGTLPPLPSSLCFQSL